MQYVNGIGLTFFFWCLGGLSLMVCLIVYCNNEWSDNNWGLENPKLQKWLHHYSVIMLFFWIGDIVAAWALARLLLGAYTLSVFKVSYSFPATTSYIVSYFFPLHTLCQCVLPPFTLALLQQYCSILDICVAAKLSSLVSFFF